MKRVVVFKIIFIMLILSSSCFPQLKTTGSSRFPESQVSFMNPDKYFQRFSPVMFDSTRIIINGPTDECDVYLRNRSLMKEVSIIKMADSTVYFAKDGVTRNIHINEINKIRFAGPSGFWTGAAVGAGISFLGWTFIGLAFADKEHFDEIFLVGLAGGIPCGLVGGLIGLIFEKDNAFYDLSSGNPRARLKRLRYIIGKHTVSRHL